MAENYSGVAGESYTSFAPNLLGMLLGVGTGGLGGLLGAIGPKIFSFLGGGSSMSQQAIQTLLDKIPQAAKESLYSAAGRTGEATRTGFEQAFNTLQTSADARQAAQAQQALASTLLGQSNRIAEQMRSMAQQQLGAQTRQTLDAIRQAGGGVSGIVRGASQLGRSYGEGLAQTMGSIGSAANQAISQAASMKAAAPEILNRDIANRYQVFVRPFEAQMSNLGTAAISNVPQMVQAYGQSAAVVNPLAGLSAALGSISGGLISGSMTPSTTYRWFHSNPQNTYNK